jgi:hypothetical protein
MTGKPTIRERIEHNLRAADPDEWFTSREIAERINAKLASVRGELFHLHYRERVLERRDEDRGEFRNPRTGDHQIKVYRWKR